MNNTGTIIICIGSILCNIAILSIVIKIYSEIIKVNIFTMKKKEDIKP